MTLDWNKPLRTKNRRYARLVKYLPEYNQYCVEVSYPSWDVFYYYDPQGILSKDSRMLDLENYKDDLCPLCGGFQYKCELYGHIKKNEASGN